MPSPERGGPPDQPEQHPASEQEPARYQRAARFAGERPAGEAYVAAQQVIYEGPPNDLSVYRFQLNRLWHVAALGLVPPAPVLQAIETILDQGEPAELPAEVWQTLEARRRQAIQRSSWTERHFRPGREV
jgi:hypothetical protein